ncbi:archaemetzincin family Zn-dependent metalloprotease [Sulfolobus tengchongensis]|uniref:Archaemetzincin n=1 Tax=Sulfolobus tengchongensis TaxID=207809 RepID=A0AAX4L4Q1_9CREN
MNVMKVLLVILSNIEKSIMDELIAHLSNYGLKVDILFDSRKYLPISAFNWDRLQFDAEKALNFLKNLYDFNYDSIVFIVDADGYVNSYNFVFGLTIDKVAIVFTSRLREEFYNRKPNPTLFMERLIKEVTHEIGHTLGLSHCNNMGCVMNFSNTIEDVDKKEAYFCEKCKYKVNEKLAKYRPQR